MTLDMYNVWLISRVENHESFVLDEVLEAMEAHAVKPDRVSTSPQVDSFVMTKNE